MTDTDDLVARNELMDRDYIPLAGGWEVQTKGKGSTFRIARDGSPQRFGVHDERLHAPLEQMARDANAKIRELRDTIEELKRKNIALERKLAIDAREELIRANEEADKLAAALLYSCGGDWPTETGEETRREALTIAHRRVNGEPT